MGKGDKKDNKGTFKGQLGQNQFISFSDVLSNTQGNVVLDASTSTTSSTSLNYHQSTSTPLLSPVYQGDDVDLAVSSKRLLKKDSSTRLKAIKEIETKLSDEGTSSSILSTFLPFFTYSYPRLTFDEDRKVREQLQKALMAIVVLEKRSLQDYMKLLIGPWIVATADPCTEVAKAAIDTFEKAIPPKKRQSVIMLLSPYILKHMQKNLAQTPEKLCNPECLGQKISPICTKDEADECYERIIISTISSIGRIMSILEATDNEKLIVGVVDDTNEFQNDTTKIGYNDIISHSLWESFINSQESIRKVIYELMLAICKHAPSLFEEGSLKRMAHVVIKFLVETYEPNVVIMYESVLTFIRTYPNCWLYIDVPNNLMPKLRKQIKSFPSIAVQFLMPILGSIPSNEFSIHSSIIDKDPYKKKSKKSKSSEEDTNESKSTVTSVIELVDYLIDISENDSLPPELILTIDVNICEITMLMLLRKNSDERSSNVTDTDTDTDSIVKLVASKLISSALMIIKNSNTNKNLDEYTNSIESLLKVFIQLTRGTQKAINFSIDSWIKFLWKPLSESIRNVLCVDNYHNDFPSNFDTHNAYLNTIFKLFDACFDNTNSGIGFDGIISDIVDSAIKRIEATTVIDNTTEIVYKLAMSTNTLLHIVTNYSKLFDLTEVDIGKINSILSGPCLERMVSTIKHEESGTLCKFIYQVCQYINTNVVIKVHKLQSPLVDTLISYSMKSFSLKFLHILFESGILKEYTWNGKYLSFITSIVEFIINSGTGNCDDDIAKVCYKNSDNETNLLLIIEYCFSSSMEVQTLFLTKVYEIWNQKGYKVCLWIILSYVINFDRNKSIDPNDMPITINLVELLVSAFFNRNREQVRQRQSSISNSFIAVTSWNEIRTYLFPRLVPSVTLQFANSMISQLVIHSDDKSVTINDDNDDNDDDETQNTNMKSRKWARHVCGLLSLAQDHLLGNLSLKSIIYSLGLGDDNIWRNITVNIVENTGNHSENAAVLINCILQIQDLWKDANVSRRQLDWLGISDNNLLHITILQCIYACKELSPPSVSLSSISKDCWNLCIDALSLNESINISNFVRTLLDNSSSDRKEFIACTTAILQYCLDHSATNSTPITDDTRVVLETPFVGELIEKGSPLWYIQRNATSESAEYDIIPCTLQMTHKQAGIETYYTVTMTDQFYTKKEIQTEASRLLLQKVTTPLSIHNENTISSNDDVNFEIRRWLLSMLPTMEINSNRTPEHSNNSLMLLSQLLVIVGKHADKTIEEASSWTSLFSQYRQAISKELIKIQALSRFEVSDFIKYVPIFTVINSLLQSAIGLGDIVWLVPSLYPFCSKLQLLQLKTDCLKNDEFSELIYCYSIVLQKINWNHYKNAAVNVLKQILSLLKHNIDATNTPLTKSKLKQSILNCIKFVFLERSEKSKQVPKKQPSNPGLAALQRAEREADLMVSNWECLSLEFAVSELLVSQGHELNQKNHDSLIASSLHYIMIGRPRQSASELLKSTNVSITVSDLLAIVWNVTASPTIRLAAAKLLDVHYTNPIQDIVEEEPQKSDDNDEGDDDETDLANDTELFKKYVGEVFIEKLNNDWKSNKKHGNDTIGCLLTWLLCLQRIDTIATQKWYYRSRLGNYLRRSGLFGSALNFFLKFVPDLLKFKDLPGTLNQVYEISSNNNRDDDTMQQIASYSLYRSIVTLPAMSRFWWSYESSQGNKQKASKFIEERVRLSVAKREVELMAIASTTGRWDTNEFTVKGYAASGEITAIMIKDDTKIEMKIKLPSCYPLKNVEVECNTKIGIPESRWKRWTLQIIQLLAQQDGAVIDAILYWKKNVDSELEGLEPCPICYSIIHVKDSSLPSLKCLTCSNKFHSGCLYTWFKSSGKNKCVICQQPFNIK